MNKTTEVFFYILIRHWNAFAYFDRCVKSVLNQTYKNYRILFIDDCSDYTHLQKIYIAKKLRGHVVRFNRVRKYAIRNAYEIIHQFANIPESVIVNLDGDDWFYEKTALAYLSSIYTNPNVWLSYGECKIWDGKNTSLLPSRKLMPFHNIPYAATVIHQRSFRKHPFLPLHPRSWRTWLYKKISKKDFLRQDGTWLQFVEDQAIFFPLLEMVVGNFQALTRPLYVYNLANKNSDIKVNTIDLLKDELIIRKKQPYAPLAP